MTFLLIERKLKLMLQGIFSMAILIDGTRDNFSGHFQRYTRVSYQVRCNSGRSAMQEFVLDSGLPM